jgi:archaellin
MRSFLARPAQERGLAAIDAAVILGTFVLAASAFGAAVLATGRLSTQEFERTAFSALKRTTTGIELRGQVVARTDGTRVTHILLDVGNTAGNEPVNLDPLAAENRTTVVYIDASRISHDVPYTVLWVGGDGDMLLEEGETGQIVIDVSGLTSPQSASLPFTVEVRPAQGTGISIRRTMPQDSGLDPILTLW